MQNSKSPSLAGGMFTSCPNCQKQFRIQASQLSIADGQVKCGVCDHEFSALPRLSDVPLTLEQMNYEFYYEPEENPVEEEPGEEPDFDIFEQAMSEKDGPEEAHGEVDSETVINGDTPSEVISLEEAKLDISESDETDTLSEFPNEIHGDIPDELRETLPVKRSLLATISWAFGALLLVVIITAQLVWFNRDELLLRYPQLDPVAREICDRFQCEILRYKDISSIKLLNRDVRNHPIYEGSLLVNATMANKSETIQPFPRIQLALFNHGGEVIAYREFNPEEYLDDSIDIPAGMMPESPIHFVLEVGGPTEGAVSFEFHFL
jgi:predicted Zn finger-like uncharacterized protein